MRALPYNAWFEGVCLTHVILAPGACGYGAWGAVLDTVSTGCRGCWGCRASSERLDVVRRRVRNVKFARKVETKL